MSGNVEAVRQGVARVLAFRRQRWLNYLFVFGVEAAALGALGGAPVLVLVLPVLAVVSLTPFYMLGRHPLPDAEFEDPHFRAYITGACACFGTNIYFRHRYARDIDDKQKSLRIVADRSHRGLHGNRQFLAIHAPGTSLYVTARSYWLQHGSGISYGDVSSIGVDLFAITETVDDPRDDDEVIGSTWHHATKRGERDLRYKDNWQVWEVRRHAVELAFGEYRWLLNMYPYDNARQFADVMAAITKQAPTLEYDEEDNEAEDEEAGSIPSLTTSTRKSPSRSSHRRPGTTF